MTNIYVGNLPFSTNEEEVRNLFSAYGTVDAVSLNLGSGDRGGFAGFGFVEMSSGGDEAIAALNQTELGGRRLVVNLAKPREETPAKALVGRKGRHRSRTCVFRQLVEVLPVLILTLGHGVC